MAFEDKVHALAYFNSNCNPPSGRGAIVAVLVALGNASQVPWIPERVNTGTSEMYASNVAWILVLVEPGPAVSPVPAVTCVHVHGRGAAWKSMCVLDMAYVHKGNPSVSTLPRAEIPQGLLPDINPRIVKTTVTSHIG